MGFIKAAIGAAGGQLSDQWREFFSCDALGPDVLMAKGEHVTSGRSSNTRGSDNVITEGSVIAVADGQCVLCVEQGAIVDIVAEPGEFTWDSKAQPSIFYGDLEQNITASFEEMGRRFGFGGQAGVDQRIYYVNTKEIIGNKYGTASPIPFRIIDRNIGLDLETSVRCNGEYSYRIIDPLVFYKEVAGNIDEAYTRDKIDSQLKTELLSALQPAFGKLSAQGVRYSEIPLHTSELCDLLNEELSVKWGQLRGLKVVSFGVNSITVPEEIEKRLAELQTGAIFRDQRMAAGQMASAYADSMRSAASNEAGAMNGFIGMGMSGAAGGSQVSQLFAQADAQQQASPQVASQSAPSDAWTCSCGTTVQGNFCSNCGSPKPTAWVCECGSQNTGRFCPQCGKQKAQAWVCACGSRNEGKFCANCGTPRP